MTSSIKPMLLAEQAEFITSNAATIVYVGGVGAGKTHVACIKAVKQAKRGRTQMLIGLTYSQAKDVIFQKFIELFEEWGMKEGVHYRANKSDLEIKIRGAKRIYIKSAMVGEKLRGYTISDAYIDEAAYLKDQNVYNVLVGRLREPKQGQRKGQIHLTTSPRGYNWVYDLTKRPDVKTIVVSSFKNSFLSEDYLINMLRTYSGKFAEQELMGAFVQMSSGLFSSEWLRPGHKFQGTQAPERIRFWDLGFGDDTEDDYSSGVLMAKYGESYIIEDIIRVKQQYDVLRETIINTAVSDGPDVTLGIEKAGQQKGIIKNLFGDKRIYNIVKRSLTVAKYGHKIKRILPLASMAQQGFVYISNKCRNKSEFKHELDALTLDDSHRFDDMADAAASAYILHNEGGITRGYKGLY